MTSDDAQQIWDLAKAMADAEASYKVAVWNRLTNVHIDTCHELLMKARKDCLAAINAAVEE